MMNAGSRRDSITTTVDRMREGLADFFWDAFIALQVNGISGDYVEFGSWGGNTLSLAYECIRDISPERHLWAFDSFEGLPEVTHPRDARWPSGGPGQGGVEKFHEEVAARGVPRNAYTTVEGYYDKSLPPLGTNGGPVDIALAYVDCNMYSSTVSVFEFLAPRLKHGMVIGFDDYYCYSAGDVSGERAALREFMAAHPQWSFLRYKEIHWCGTSFIVEDVSRLPSDIPG